MSVTGSCAGGGATLQHLPTPQNPDDFLPIYGLNRAKRCLQATWIAWLSGEGSFGCSLRNRDHSGCYPHNFPPRGDPMRNWLVLGLAFGLGLAFADGASAQVKLGITGPITGGSAAFGAQIKNGTEQAVEDIN